jgi:biotin transporter BioY
VTVVGFVAVALLPFLKYAPAPPAVGNAETIGHRTAVYFGFQLVSVVAAVLAVVVSTRVWRARGAYAAVLAGVLGYVAVMAAAAILMPVVDEIGDFPASTLWQFRLGSLFTLTTLWGTIGIVLTALVGRKYAEEMGAQRRREVAASL